MSRPIQFCTIDQCDQRRVGRKLCRKHYQRWKRWGDPVSKCCTKCKEPKNAETEFYAVNGQKDSFVSWCKSCLGAGHKVWTKCKQYGLAPGDYERLFELQGGVCGICGTDEPGGVKTRFCIDHDRTCCPGNSSCGECVRGLLCSRCNQGLGLFKDSPESLNKAVSWLQSGGPWKRKISLAT